jgi:hypothetical protein
MSKIIKKNDITKLVESTMIQAGLLKEGDSKPDFLDLDKDGDKEEPMKKAANESEGDEFYGSHGNSGKWYSSNSDEEYDMNDDEEWDEVEYENYEDYANSPHNNKWWYNGSSNPKASKDLFNRERNNNIEFHDEEMFNPLTGKNYKQNVPKLTPASTPNKLKVRTRRQNTDPVTESVNRLAKDASKHNIITENFKNDLERFNKIMNYKYH